MRRPTPEPTDIDDLLRAAVDLGEVGRRSDRWPLDQLLGHGGPALRAARAMLAAAVAASWTRGWTPTDLVHVVERRLDAGHVEVVVRLAVADGRHRLAQGQPLHPRWQEQLAELERRETTRPLGFEQELRLHLEVLVLLGQLPDLPRTLPGPGEAWEHGARGSGHLDARMLERVRALLAKAESTPFEEEAEAFTAKAQELIARYAIDGALLDRGEEVAEPVVRRLHIDDPYARAKATIVAEVASANRCRVVQTPAFGWVTVFGFAHDLDAVELLSASLLAQAVGAMVRHGPERDPSGRSRTRSFRRAFLLGFGHRIGQRLRRATEEQMAATADPDGRLVPVLAVRDERLAAAQEAVFPVVVRKATTASNARGWSAGEAAAQLARLEVSPHLGNTT